MKQYILFTGYDYYPQGGWEDFRGEFDTLEEAIKAAVIDKDDWYQIVDLSIGKIIEQGRIENLCIQQS